MMTKIKLLTTKEINAAIEQIDQIKSNADYESFWSNVELQYENFPRHELGATSTKFYNMIDEKASEAQLAEFLSKRLLISRAQAAESQYWITLNFIYFSEFIRSLYEDKSDDIDKLQSNLKSHFIQTSSQGSLLKGPISGLWWAAKITVLPMHDYTYTYKFLKHRNLRFKNLGGHQIIRHQPSLLALLDFLEDNSELKVQSTGNLIGAEAIAQAMSKALNQIAGTRLISVFNQEEIKEILEKYKSYIIKLAIDIHIGKRGITEEEFYDLDDMQGSTENIDDNIIDDNVEEPVIKEQILEKEPLEVQSPLIQLPPIISVVSNVTNKIEGDIDRYFLLNKHSREYVLSKQDNASYDIRIALNSTMQDQYLLHFYEEGKINRTYIGKSFFRKDLERTYLNGANGKLTLLDVLLVPQEFYIGIAYRYRRTIYVKIYSDNIMRDDNYNLVNEGKKLIYLEGFDAVAYKVLPKDMDNEILSNLVLSSPTAQGMDLSNDHYNKAWKPLTEIWPELLSNTLFKDYE